MYKFKQDIDELDLCGYWQITDFLSAKEMSKIDALSNSLPKQDGGTFNKSKDARTSIVQWISPNILWDWLFKKIVAGATAANNALWKFQMEALSESIQYTTYEASHHYDWHVDYGFDQAECGAFRKISCTVLLSDPETDFEGGELQWKGRGFTDTPIIKKGTAVFFPSFWPHRVKPITKGRRKSLVAWSSGPPFR